jgi:hypothetical protein
VWRAQRWLPGHFFWTRGRHSFNFGGEFRREQDNGSGVGVNGQGGEFFFNAGAPLTTTIPSTNGGSPLPAGTPCPSGLISMMEGDESNYSKATTAVGYGPPGGGSVTWGLRRWNMAGYAQDDIKVARRLTQNVGLRCEYANVPSEVYNRFTEPEDFGSLYDDFVANPRPLWQPDYVSGDFDPRLGFALGLGKNTVLRGGWGGGHQYDPHRLSGPGFDILPFGRSWFLARRAV